MQKQLIKLFLKLHIWLYRLTGGRIGAGKGPFRMLLLTNVGAKSGKTFVHPLGHFRDGDNYVIIASNGGLAKNPNWYYNLKANPNSTIQVMEQVINITATVASASERQRLWQILMDVAPSYGNYAKKTTREIPLVILHPVK